MSATPIASVVIAMMAAALRRRRGFFFPFGFFNPILGLAHVRQEVMVQAPALAAANGIITMAVAAAPALCCAILATSPFVRLSSFSR